MATKQFNSRIQWKKDTSANWTANNPVLLNGEIAIVVTNTGETRFKVGDGTSAYTALPFQDEAVRALITAADDKIDAHIADTDNPHEVTKAQIGLSNVDNVKQYSASNPPPYPVTSVNSKTGSVVLSASDVGAIPKQSGTTGQLLGFVSTNTVGTLDASSVISTIYNTRYSGTIGSSGWVSSGNLYYITRYITGMTIDQNVLVFPNWTGNEEKEKEKENWNNLTEIDSYNGYVRIWSTKPFTRSVGYTLLYNK